MREIGKGTMSTVEAKHVWKIYDGDVVAVEDANFKCENEEFVAVLGPSGCGKSSTLRMLAGLEDISKGEMLFDGKVVNSLSPRERNVALAFESYALYPPLTVYENIAFPLRARDINKAEIDRKVRSVAEDLELSEVLRRKPGKLSGGQQQRVSLARALVRDPSVLLLDEPLSHMDQRVRTVIRARIRRIHDELNTTTIYVTHDQDEAVALADKIIVMSMGLIQQIGSADDLYKTPANQFVAGFIGEPAMNFIKGEVGGINQVWVHNEEEPKSWGVSECIPDAAVNTPVLVGLRPEDIKVSKEAPSEGVKARVEVVEYQGEELILTMALNGDVLKAIVPIDFSVQEFDHVWMTVPPEDLHVFDQKTGEALIKTCEM
jgi:multiple sugar transport system ATP-binding protein